MEFPDTLPELFAEHSNPPVDRAALLLARDAYPRLEVDDYLHQLNDLSMPLVACMTTLPSLPVQAEELARYLYDELGYKGDDEDYYDPRNRYLNTVMDRRRGIPITLATVVMAVADRAGLTIDGVGFPGHFLLRLGGPGGLYLDPFARLQVLTESDLQALARRFLGAASRLRPEHLEPVNTRTMVVRMLTNLKSVYASRREHSRAMLVCDRLVDLDGGAEQRRDRGIHALAVGAYGAGIADLDAYLSAQPGASDADALRAMLVGARAKRRTVMQ